MATPQGHLIKELIDKEIIEDNGVTKFFCIRPRCSGIINEDKTITIEKIFSCDLLSSFDDAFNPDSYRNRRYKLTRNKNIRYNLSENKEEA